MAAMSAASDQNLAPNSVGVASCAAVKGSDGSQADNARNKHRAANLRSGQARANCCPPALRLRPENEFNLFRKDSFFLDCDEFGRIVVDLAVADEFHVAAGARGRP
jgi:hypothetical protein